MGTHYSNLKVNHSCPCRRRKIFADETRRKETRAQGKSKRRTFVYNADEEMWHEPYMQGLRHEFLDDTETCDSKIELPWQDIALPTAGVRIRPDVGLASPPETGVPEVAGVGARRDESDADIMTLPWQDLLITDVLPSGLLPDADAQTCDSSLEIPWADITLEAPMHIQPPRKEEPCAPDGMEIPWDEILVPRNIVIRPEKPKRHPSSGRRPSRARPATTCIACDADPCCGKTARANPMASTINIKASIWTANCM